MNPVSIHDNVQRRRTHAFLSLALVISFLGILELCLGSLSSLSASEAPVSKEEIDRHRPKLENVKGHIKFLSNLKSRVPGSAGNQAARDYIIEQLQTYGYSNAVAGALMKSGDAAPETALLEAAFSEAGQSLTLGAAAEVGPRNIRITISDAEASITGGEIFIKGVSLDDLPLTETIQIKGGVKGLAITVADRPFKKIESIVARKFIGSMVPGLKIQATYGIRYFIGTQKFQGVSPVETEAGHLVLAEAPEVEVLKVPLPLYGIWPNGAAVSTTGPAGISGRLIYGKNGRPSDFNGLDMRDAVVVLDVTEKLRWTQAAGIGAKAIIFLEPEGINRSTLEKLFLSTPVEIPRLWISHTQGQTLKKYLLAERAKNNFPTATLNAKMKWQSGTWENIYLMVPGTGKFTGNPKRQIKLAEALAALDENPATIRSEDKNAASELLKKLKEDLARPNAVSKQILVNVEQLSALLADPDSIAGAVKGFRNLAFSTVVLSAYFDSNSVIPALAPGAEQAIGCAALLEIARGFKTNPPVRDTLLFFANGHFQGLKGEREFFAAVAALPDAFSNEKLLPILQENPVYLNLTDHLAENAAGKVPERAQLLLKAEEFLAAETKKQESFADLTSAKLKNQISVGWVIAAIALLVLAMGWWGLKKKGRGLAVAIFVPGAIIILCYTVLIPLVARNKEIDEGANKSAKMVDRFLKVWKEAVGSEGAKRERTMRILRGQHKDVSPAYANLLKQLSDAEEKKNQASITTLKAQLRKLNEGTENYLNACRDLPGILASGNEQAIATHRAKIKEFEAAPKEKSKGYLKVFLEKRAHEDLGNLLYTRMDAGSSVTPPLGLTRLATLIKSTRQMARDRFTLELDWSQNERTRRQHNRSFEALVQTRLQLTKENGKEAIFLSLDLSAGNAGIGLFYKGKYYNQPGPITAKYRNKGFGVRIRKVAQDVELGLGITKEFQGSFAPDTLKEALPPRGWQTYLGTPLAVAAEIAVQSQIRGLTLATTFDQRMKWDTPQDLLGDGEASARAWSNIDRQMEFLGAFLNRLSALGSTTAESYFHRVKYTGFSQLIVKAVRRGGSRSIFPNVPVPGGLIFQVGAEKTLAGVRRPMVEPTDPFGHARLVGVRKGSLFSFEAYQTESKTGEIQFAINKPMQGLNENKSFSTQLTQQTRTETVELFRAQGLAILDLVDPGRMIPLKNSTLLAGQTESKPQQFGSSHTHGSEPHRVLFAEPGSRIKCLFREGQFGLRLAILDVQPDALEQALDPQTSAQVSSDDARGPGFLLGSKKVLDWLPLRATQDLWSLGEQRLNNLRKHSIGNPRLDNPEYPGIFSAGTIAATKGSVNVQGAGVSWTKKVAGLRLTIEGHFRSYRVKNWEAPDKIILEDPFEGINTSKRPFTLTNAKPGLHNLSKIGLVKAREAKEKKDYGEAWQLATRAWGIESRAYPEVLGTANDSVLGVVFYLFLLLPFCFFCERLLFGFPKIEQQIGVAFGIFVMMFALLWMVHPAFSLVRAPPIILLAFVIMTLSSIVILLIYGKFNTEMKLIQEGVKGVQSADVNRASAAMVAVSLGISQMRRRKVRTLLTCVTIVLLTFTALSFTSMVPSLSQASIDLSPGNIKDAPYSGILLRHMNFGAMNDLTLEQVNEEFSADGFPVAPRYWSVAKKVIDQYEEKYIDLFYKNKRVSPSALLGLSPTERLLFQREGKDPIKEALVAGDWLREEDLDVCILPEKLAKSLEVGKPDDRDWKPEDAIGEKIWMGSYAVEIRGLYSSAALSEIRDIDGEAIMPVDFEASEASKGSGETHTDNVTVENLESASVTKFIHVNGWEAVIVPWRLARLFGGSLRSVAVKIESQDEDTASTAILDYRVSGLLKLLEKSLFVGRAGRRILYASTQNVSLTGLGNLIVPLLISVLILLNTMIGAVFERNREIRIFSALGLSPSHISALFLAEAFVYATLGAILGYLMGQGVAKIIQELEISGLYLNYSSKSAVFVTALVMLAVLGSTIYPALMAARVSAPSEDRNWGVPKPNGDEISIELPFSFQRDLVPGAALFLHEFFERHAESSLGNFTAKDVTLEAFHSEKGKGICLFFMAWLAPYDLGVSQEVQLYLIPIEDELYISEAAFYRVSGYVASWERVNLPFLNTLRKHLLSWRTLSPEQRQEFSERGFEEFKEALDAVGWKRPKGFRTKQLKDPDLHVRGKDDPNLPPNAAPEIVGA